MNELDSIYLHEDAYVGIFLFQKLRLIETGLGIEIRREGATVIITTTTNNYQFFIGSNNIGL